MKKAFQRLLAAIMSVALVATTMTVYAADEFHIEWFVKQNASNQAANYPHNWPFAYEYFDVSSKSFKTMEQDLGDNGWADTTTSAVIKPWEQVATDSKYAVVIYCATQKGNLTLQNRQNFSGTGQVMLLQKNAEGKFAVLKDWTDAGTTWVDTTTYANADECIYFIYRAASGSATASFVPQVRHDKGSSDTQNKYPTTWKTINEIMFPSEEPQVPKKTSEISWFVTQSAEGQATNYPSNWPFTYEYFDVTGKQFKTMENARGGQNGWADTTESAIVTPWTQNATDSKYAAVVYYATQKGTVLVQNKNNATLKGVNENGQIMLLQKKADGTFSVLQDWKDIPKDGTLAWTEASTYVQAGEMIYFVYRSASGTQARVEDFTPQVTQYLGNEDTQNQYPTEWSNIADILCPEPQIETWTGDIGWFVTQNAADQAANYPHNWPFTYEYFDVKGKQFKAMENARGGQNGWADTTESAIVTPWTQNATDSKYAAVVYYATQEGTVLVQNKNNASLKGLNENGQIMLLQKKADGTFSVLQDWKDIPKDETLAWTETSTYVQAGEMIYFVYRSASGTQARVEDFTPQVTQYLGNEDTQNQYPTEWSNIADILCPAPPTETWTGDISWFVTQWIQPWESSPFTFEYFDAAKMKFHELEAWNHYESPAYWQDATGMACIKGWEMVSSDVKYAATTFHADQQGIVTLTNNTTITGSAVDGEFMLLQKNAENKYAVLLDWTAVPAGKTVTLPNVTTYVLSGDTVYYLYRSTSDRQAVGGITPNVVYVKGALDDEEQYPTSWKELDEIFEKKEEQNTTAPVKYHEIQASSGNGGSVVAINGSNAVGKDLTYQIVPNKGYEIAEVIVDGVSIGRTSRYTFTELREDHTIEVKFSKTTETVAWIESRKDEQDA